MLAASEPACRSEATFHQQVPLLLVIGSAADALRAASMAGEPQPEVVAALRGAGGLDEDQAVALLAALRNELVLIQGPPGTGGCAACLESGIVCAVAFRGLRWAALGVHACEHLLA